MKQAHSLFANHLLPGHSGQLSSPISSLFKFGDFCHRLVSGVGHIRNNGCYTFLMMMMMMIMMMMVMTWAVMMNDVDEAAEKMTEYDLDDVQ